MIGTSGDPCSRESTADAACKKVHVDAYGLPISLRCWLYRQRDGYVVPREFCFAPFCLRFLLKRPVHRNATSTMSSRSKSSSRDHSTSYQQMTRICCAFWTCISCSTAHSDIPTLIIQCLRWCRSTAFLRRDGQNRARLPGLTRERSFCGLCPFH